MPPANKFLITSMTKREVIKLVLDGKTPPWVPWSYSFTVDAALKLQEHYGTEDIDSLLDNHFVSLGSGTGKFEYIENNCYRDVFGVVWDRSIDKDIGNIKGILLPEPDLSGYSFPDPLNKRFFDGIPERIKKYEDRYRIFRIGFSLFERAWTLRGMENLMMDFFDFPDFVKELLNTIADYNITQVKKALEYDIDAVYFGDDWGQQRGLLMGPAIWREFIYPVLKRMYSEVKKADRHVFIHSCGDVDELFDDLISIGLDCFNPFQPEVMDTEALLKKYRGKLAFHGGLSIQKTLPFGTADEVRAETERLIALGRKGGFILSPSHAVPGDVPLENLLAFIETTKDQKGIKNR